MATYQFRLADKKDRQAIVHFMNTHWEIRHPLVNLPDFFDYYYKGEGMALHFALAEQDGTLAALAGYIPANRNPQPDIWVSLWVADKAAKGSGLELMAALPALTGCRTLACNNIRPETRPFYAFLGYTTGRVSHFYRLAEKETYAIASVARKEILPASGAATLHLLENDTALAACSFALPQDANPIKDLWYITRRYFHFPRQSYRLYAAYLPGEQTPRALLALRATEIQNTNVLRLVDYIGEPSFFSQLGTALDSLLREENAEYADIYCVGIPPETLRQAGFTERAQDDENIIPNYLAPLLCQNTEYYYFTNNPNHFTLFRADGDQDRPHVEMP